LILLVGPE